MDTQARFSQAAGVKGLPTTFLIDEKGREVGRIRGIVEWDGPKIKAQIRELIRKAKENEKKERELTKENISPSTGSENIFEEKNTSPPADSVPPPPVRPIEEIQSWFK